MTSTKELIEHASARCGPVTGAHGAALPPFEVRHSAIKRGVPVETQPSRSRLRTGFIGLSPLQGNPRGCHSAATRGGIVAASMKTLPAGLVLATLLVANGRSENWAQWREAHYFNGSTTEKNLPVEWSKTNNVAWITPLPGYSGATPVIWGDSVFVSSPDPQKNLLLLCLDRKDGKIRWQKVVATGDREKGRNNMASPSPVTDGKSVFVLFGTGDLAAYVFPRQGTLAAKASGKDYGKLSINWLYGSSPLLYKDRLYIEVIQRTPVPEDYTAAVDGKPDRESYLLCLDPKTGKNLWRQIRPTDAIVEAQEAYSTPIPCENKRRATEIILVGGDYTTAHSAETGAGRLLALRRLEDDGRGTVLAHRSVAGKSSPVVDDPWRADRNAIRCSGRQDGGNEGWSPKTNIVMALQTVPLGLRPPVVLRAQTLRPRRRSPDDDLTGPQNRRKEMAG